MWLKTCLLVALFSYAPVLSVHAGQDPRALIGPKDALLVMNPDGSTVYAVNPNRKRIPASTLKLFTSLLALHHLGSGYRFKTDFFLDTRQNLIIKGYGDPLLISEVIAAMAKALAAKLTRVSGIILDDAFFSQPMVIPGRSISRQPYDAPNGALCANFNTIKFKKDSRGNFISTEPQTPLVPFVMPKLRARGIDSGRIVLSHQTRENVLYVGHLFLFFLRQNGVQCSGVVRVGRVNPKQDRRILRYMSPFTLEEIVAKLLEHSNNFIANQLVAAVGAHVKGPPGEIQKGVTVGNTYARDTLKLATLTFVEGSGISRQNRLSARDLDQIMEAFEPYRHLMTKKGRVYFKTGSLYGISTRAGFIERGAGGWYRFAILINSPGKSAETVVRSLLTHLD